MTKHLTTKEVARELGVSQSTVVRWVRCGHLRAVQMGPRIIRVPCSEVERLQNYN